ncbi:acyl-coenzyme A thioesterase 8 [Platysternon megacephalum]|uniref:Acyl-coenzyme A thioesterase 8 n=1 Tax=Platysternon megacephalum TaxID=55544 RepID=A0A4D9E8G4_9SAUR|nr:acyl-coenzyme A thioesterase 8 [Platysternon megacephalum]
MYKCQKVLTRVRLGQGGILSAPQCRGHKERVDGGVRSTDGEEARQLLPFGEISEFYSPLPIFKPAEERTVLSDGGAANGTTEPLESSAHLYTTAALLHRRGESMYRMIGGRGSELPSGSVSLSPILAHICVGCWQHTPECARNRHSSTFTPIHRHGIKMQRKGAPAQRWAPHPALCSCRQSLCGFSGSRIRPCASFGRAASFRAGSSVRQVCIVAEHGRNSPSTVPEGPLANVPHPCTRLIRPETHWRKDLALGLSRIELYSIGACWDLRGHCHIT